MFNTRRREAKKVFDELYKQGDTKGVFKQLNLLYSSNDFLDKPCDSFEWTLNSCKGYIDRFREFFFNKTLNPVYPLYLDLYFDIINKTVEFMKDNIKDNDLYRYVFLHKLLYYNLFSGGEVDESHKYEDLILVPGLDVMLGNSCCRHKADLLKSILENFTETLQIDIGREKGEMANHVIISFNYDENRLFLDSVIPYIYFPKSDLRLIDYKETRYIKSTISYVFNKEFKDINEYYSFFRNLCESSKMSKEYYILLLAMIKSLDEYYEIDKDLLYAFYETIKEEQIELKLMCKKKTP